MILCIVTSLRCLKNFDLDFIDGRFIKKLDPRKGGASSSGGRLTLVDSCLSNLPSYIIAMFLLNKTFIERLNKHRRHFFWHGKKQKRGIWLNGLGYVDPRKKAT
jgi:hypothetical protein